MAFFIQQYDESAKVNTTFDAVPQTDNHTMEKQLLACPGACSGANLDLESELICVKAVYASGGPKSYRLHTSSQQLAFHPQGIHRNARI